MYNFYFSRLRLCQRHQIYVRRREPRSSVLLHGLYSVLPEVLST